MPLSYNEHASTSPRRAFRGSSTVERPAVNRRVVGSNPTRGASCFREGTVWSSSSLARMDTAGTKSSPSEFPRSSSEIDHATRSGPSSHALPPRLLTTSIWHHRSAPLHLYPKNFMVPQSSSIGADLPTGVRQDDRFLGGPRGTSATPPRRARDTGGSRLRRTAPGFASSLPDTPECCRGEWPAAPNRGDCDTS